MIRDSVASFAKASLAPRVRTFEGARGLPEDVRRLAHEMGLGVMVLPKQCGGQDLGLVAAVLAEEELGAADAAAASALPGPGAFGLAVTEIGNEAQAEAWLSDFVAEDATDRYGAVAWSEPAPHPSRPGFVTTATRDSDSWVLRGKKVFVGNAGLADRFVVFAQIDESLGWRGIGAFLVRSDSAGSALRIGTRHATLGLDAAHFGEVELVDVRVPESARLGSELDAPFTSAALRFFAKHALFVAARALGVARCAFDIAREYCDTRKAFGKPIGHFQAVAFTLADRHMDVESSRWLLWRAASAWDNGRPEKERLLKTAQAVAHTLDAAMRAADDCVSLHGGAGFIRDLVAEKLMRDAKQLALSCPTSEQLDQLSAALDLGSNLDPALVLPTPETQAIFT